MPHLLTQIPQAVLDGYSVEINHIQELDASGEDCANCDRDLTYVQVQFYGVTRDGQDVYGQCCADCLRDALEALNVDPYASLVIEVER